MTEDTIVLTKEGFAKLEAELEELKGPRRREIADRLKIAISYGDLRENSEYHAAKDDQAHLETRIKQIEAMLRNARVVEQVASTKVVIGSTVVLYDEEFDENITYKIVGQAEANAGENMISYQSPMGAALMGKSVDDMIYVDAPVGRITYKLLEIK